MEEYQPVVQKLFTDSKWDKMEENDQMKCAELLYTATACSDLNIDVQAPSFMVRVPCQQKEAVNKMLSKIPMFSYKCAFCKKLYKKKVERKIHLKFCKKRQQKLKEKAEKKAKAGKKEKKTEKTNATPSQPSTSAN